MKKLNQANTEPVVTAGLRLFLYLTATLTGGAILVVEILGAKMLAPFLGTSHFVWTAQIAVTLVALASGYYAGGWLADRTPQLNRLYFCVLIAALYLCVAMRLSESIANACLRFDLALGALMSSLALFFVPLTLLAVTGPFLVRILTTSMSQVGGQVGRLSSISTLGSVIGTILIGYVLIPHLANSVTLYLTAAVLAATALIYFLVWERRPASASAVSVTLGLGLLLVLTDPPPGPLTELNMEEIFRGNSAFGLMQVCQETGGNRRYYLNDYLLQNTYDIEAKKSLSLFTYMLHGLARAHNPKIQDALCIGLGVGIVPMALARDGARVDVVEINPAVVPLAARFFDLEPERLHITIGDGRFFLNRCQKKYDTLILDAFLGDSSPSHLMTREAFTAMRQVLRDDGTLVINSFGDFVPGKDFFTASLEQTLRAVFKSVRIYSETGAGNVFYVASNRASLPDLPEPDLTQVHPYCQSRVVDAWRNERHTDPGHGRILTDDFNPADYYDGQNRMELRRALALSMRPRAGQAD